MYFYIFFFKIETYHTLTTQIISRCFMPYTLLFYINQVFQCFSEWLEGKSPNFVRVVVVVVLGINRKLVVVIGLEGNNTDVVVVVVDVHENNKNVVLVVIVVGESIEM